MCIYIYLYNIYLFRIPCSREAEMLVWVLRPVLAMVSHEPNGHHFPTPPHPESSIMLVV